MGASPVMRLDSGLEQGGGGGGIRALSAPGSSAVLHCLLILLFISLGGSGVGMHGAWLRVSVPLLQVEKQVGEWVENQVTKIDEAKWGCKLSTKMFVAKEFVYKHVRGKHTHLVDAERQKVGREPCLSWASSRPPAAWAWAEAAAAVSSDCILSCAGQRVYSASVLFLSGPGCCHGFVCEASERVW